MFMEQSHNKQVASVDIFPTQCSSSIGSNGVIRVSFTVRNDSLMRVMLFIQHTVTGSQIPQPTFGSGLGLQCAYTVVISLWGTPAPTFLLEPPKTLFYWIAPCIRKPQAEFQKFSSTHVSPSDWFISSSWSPLLVGIKDEEYLSIWSLYFSVHVSFHFFVDDLPWPCRFVGISITALWSLADLHSGWKGIFWI